jgi:hypothetical protein
VNLTKPDILADAPCAWPQGHHYPIEGAHEPYFRRYRSPASKCGDRRSAVTAAEFEHLTASEAECLLRGRLRLFLDAGAAPCDGLLLAAQVEIAEDAAVRLLQQGLSADLALRLLY